MKFAIYWKKGDRSAEVFIALRKCEKEAEIDEERAIDIERRFNDVMNVSHKVRENRINFSHFMKS